MTNLWSLKAWLIVSSVAFEANGSVTVTQCGTAHCTSPITYLVSGSLTSPVPLTPAQPSPPPGFSSPSCARVGDDQWTVSDITYRKLNKSQCKRWYIPEQICIDPSDGSFERKGEYLALTVRNNAISHDVVCEYVSTATSDTLPAPLRCTGVDFNDITVDITLSGTAPNFSLKVEELWYCLENPSTNDKP